MLPGAFFCFGGLQVSRAAISYITSTSVNTDLNSYSFSNVSIGAAAADRYIVVAVMNEWGEDPQVAYIPASVTVGGVSATLAASRRVGADFAGVSLWIAPMPTGTTANIVVNLTSGQTGSNCAISIFRLTGLSSPTPYATASAFTGQTGTPPNLTPAVPPSTTLAIPAGGGVVIGCAAGYMPESPSIAWTGVTGVYGSVIDTDGGNEWAICAMQTFAPGTPTPITIALSGNIGDGDQTFCCAAWL